MHAAAGELSAARASQVELAERATAAGLHSIALFALLDLARLGGAQMAADRLESVPTEGDGPYAIATRAHVAALVAGDAPALAASADRFEAMGAILHAADAAAQEASLHAAEGRKGSAATARGRATVLMARCEGARTPALLGLSVDPAMASLTDRELEVVRLAASGLTNRDIAERLFVSVRTVTTHLYRSYAKLGVNDREHLAALLDTTEDDPPLSTPVLTTAAAWLVFGASVAVDPTEIQAQLGRLPPRHLAALARRARWGSTTRTSPASSTSPSSPSRTTLRVAAAKLTNLLADRPGPESVPPC